MLTKDNFVLNSKEKKISLVHVTDKINCGKLVCILIGRDFIENKITCEKYQFKKNNCFSFKNEIYLPIFAVLTQESNMNDVYSYMEGVACKLNVGINQFDLNPSTKEYFNEHEKIILDERLEIIIHFTQIEKNLSANEGILTFQPLGANDFSIENFYIFQEQMKIKPLLTSVLNDLEALKSEIIEAAKTFPDVLQEAYEKEKLIETISAYIAYISIIAGNEKKIFKKPYKEAKESCTIFLSKKNERLDYYKTESEKIILDRKKKLIKINAEIINLKKEVQGFLSSYDKEIAAQLMKSDFYTALKALHSEINAAQEDKKILADEKNIMELDKDVKTIIDNFRILSDQSKRISIIKHNMAQEEEKIKKIESNLHSRVKDKFNENKFPDQLKSLNSKANNPILDKPTIDSLSDEFSTFTEKLNQEKNICEILSSKLERLDKLKKELLLLKEEIALASKNLYSENLDEFKKRLENVDSEVSKLQWEKDDIMPIIHLFSGIDTDFHQKNAAYRKKSHEAIKERLHKILSEIKDSPSESNSTNNDIVCRINTLLNQQTLLTKQELDSIINNFFIQQLHNIHVKFNNHIKALQAPTSIVKKLTKLFFSQSTTAKINAEKAIIKKIDIILQSVKEKSFEKIADAYQEIKEILNQPSISKYRGITFFKSRSSIPTSQDLARKAETVLAEINQEFSTCTR